MEMTKPPLMPSDINLQTTNESKTSNASNPNSSNDYNGFIGGDLVYTSIIISVEFPMICLAISAVFTLIKSNQSTPVFVINLLTADLIQILCLLLYIIPSEWTANISNGTTMWLTFTRCYFMTCIAVERYIMIAHPVWHRTHRSVKCLVCASLTAWFLPLIVVPPCIFIPHLQYIMPFIPYVVIIVCFALVCRSLSHSISLTPLKKQLVLAPLFFVLMSYTFLTLPGNILFIFFAYTNMDGSLIRLWIFTEYLYMLNPLVDCLLYVFMRSDAENIIWTPHCCSKPKGSQNETQSTMVVTDCE
ncbi:G-protein coupled receptor 4-like [Danio aesculapii]|uniref:G-protein coupled receptor 4-like n=1 Tax=Danio aesculapii TaxID=1142201 RepID=UPI0024BF6C77|nr:G-protein coupled receptor 4-like [Danio aesculapii]